MLLMTRGKGGCLPSTQHLLAETLQDLWSLQHHDTNITRNCLFMSDKTSNMHIVTLYNVIYCSLNCFLAGFIVG